MKPPFLLRCVVGLTLPLVCAVAQPLSADVAIGPNDNQFVITIDDDPFAAYVYSDPEVPRPYFKHVHAPNGVRVTRKHPPDPGPNADHPTYHPGIWLAFGDINAADFWRNRTTIKTVRTHVFSESPKGGGQFSVENEYIGENDQLICLERAYYTVIPTELGTLLLWDSMFYNKDNAFVFGDQEEMGLGFRVRPELTVEFGSGTIRNSEGGVNESGTWGKQALWCDYSGELDGQRVGMTLMPHPDNFRKSWFHARDYGLLAANPFGRNAMTGGEPSAVGVDAGENLRLRFGIYVYSHDLDAVTTPEALYNDYLQRITRNDD